MSELLVIGKRIGMLAFLILLFSCSKRNITYFSNLDPDQEGKYSNSVEMKPIRIQKKDELIIKVTTLNPESNLLFNYGVISEGGEVNAESLGNYDLSKYVVDSEGNIDFPILGKVNLAGLTREEAKKKMTDLLSKLVTDPRVELSISNFKITVLGEVNNPSSFIIDSDKITILEALGLAGDMTVYGRRENVMIIREDESGKKLFRIDMNDKEILNSQDFYLMQNDVLYVEAHKKKLLQADINPTTIAILSIASSVAVALIFSFDEIFN